MSINMSRRGFLTAGGATALAGAATLLAGCASGGANETGSASGASEELTVNKDSKLNGTDEGVKAFYEHVSSVAAIAKTFANGEKVVGVAIEFDTEVDGSTVDPGNGGIGQQAQEKGLGTFSVLGRSIVTAYTNDKAELNDEGGKKKGKYVIVELDSADAGAQTMMFQMKRGCVGSNGPVSIDSGSVKICQIKDMKDASGKKLAGDKTSSRYLVAEEVINPEVDAFVSGTYDDPKTGYHAAFELREPDNYDENKKYPVTIFLPDAGVTTCDAKVNLRQGLGALAWADGSQFVLTVAGACCDVETCLHLVDNLIDQGYSIDTDRIYGTGESAGCMALIAYGSEHPDDNPFAAFMLVAGQGDMTPIKNTPMLVFVAEDDANSYGGMTDPEKGIASIGVPYVEKQLDCTYNFDGKGHTSGLWVDYDATGKMNPSGNQEGAKAADSTKTVDELLNELSDYAASACKQATADGSHIVFFHVAKGTLDSIDSTVQGGNTHNFTWQYAYSIPELIDWVRQQTAK